MLKREPFSLSKGDGVYAKLIVSDQYGQEEESEIGSGAYIISEPEPPIKLREVLESRSNSTLSLEWEASDQDGGSQITEY